MIKLWRWLTRAEAREARKREYAAQAAWGARYEAQTRRGLEWNRQEAWRTLADLERRGILTPTVKYRTLEWLTDEHR